MFGAPSGTSPLRAPSLCFRFVYIYFVPFFYLKFVAHFSLFVWITCLIMFHLLGIPFSSMIFVSIFHIFSDGFWSHFWCSFDTFSRSRVQPSKPSKTFVFFIMHFNDSNIQRNMIFDDFHDLFRYKFWPWIFMSFGIVFGSILEPLWHQISCFLVIVCVDDVLNRFLITFDQKWLQKVEDVTLTFRSFFVTCFRTVVPFTVVRHTSAINHVFQLFKKLKELIHTCTFYQRKTNKSAVTV